MIARLFLISALTKKLKRAPCLSALALGSGLLALLVYDYEDGLVSSDLFYAKALKWLLLILSGFLLSKVFAKSARTNETQCKPMVMKPISAKPKTKGEKIIAKYKK